MLTAKRTNQGLSLVELLVAIVIGLFVAGAAISIYMVGLRGSSTTLNLVRVNHELRTAMTLMTSDLRRAGYWAGAENSAVGTSATNPHDLILINAARNCILYSYDRTMNGASTGFDFFGFRLSNGRLEVYQGDSTGCNSASPTGGTWSPLSDNTSIVIEDLEFRTVGSTARSSQCRNLSTAAGTSWALQNTNAAAIVQACDATAATATGSFAAPATGNLLYEVRIIDVRLRGRSARDNGIASEMSESVKIMNDRMFPKS